MFASYVVPVNQIRYGQNGQPIVTAPNSLTTPTGPEYQLQLSEGIYVLRDEILLGPIPPHPSEPIVNNPNILDTRLPPPTGPVRVSVARFTPRKKPTPLSRVISPNGGTVPDTIKENEVTDTIGGLSRSLGKFGGFTKSGAAQKKHVEPKSAINKSSSSFISRFVPHDQYAKRMQEHDPDGLFAFLNTSRAFEWLDMSSVSKHEQLVKVLFTKAHPLCHHPNPFTASKDSMDLAIGYSSADILWYETISGKYTRINKNGAVNETPVSEIRWLPNSDDLLVAAHFDGTLVVYDRARDDAAFVPEEDTQRAPGERQRFQVKKSMRSPNQKTNPVAVWKLANQRINGMEFSPDGRFLAVVSECGTLKILDHAKEQLLDMYSSYYGGITCVCWSPDGRFLVTGGQDDLLSIWSFDERRLVSRCIGHRSWVTSVAFDPWRCDYKSYRFGSVGEDARLLLWDFSPSMLHRPRVGSVQQSISQAPRKQSQLTTSAYEVTGNSKAGSVEESDEIRHTVAPRITIPMLPPVLSKEIDTHALSWITFEEECIMTACKEGHIRTWDRPREDASARTASITAGFADPFRA